MLFGIPRASFLTNFQPTCPNMQYLIDMMGYQRQALTGACLSYLGRQIERLGLDIQVVFTDSEYSCFDVVPNWVASYSQALNEPLSDKAQASLNNCRQVARDDFAGVIKLDTDDFLSDRALLSCCQLLDDGLTGQYNYLYVFDALKQKMKGIHKVTPFGPGRIVSAQALNTLDWQLYEPGLNRGLDQNAVKHIEQAGVDYLVFINHPGEVIIDVKAGRWLTNPNNFKGIEIEIDEVLKHLDGEAQDFIKNYSSD